MICFKCGNISYIPCSKKKIFIPPKPKELRLKKEIENNIEAKNKNKKKKYLSVRELANKEIEKVQTPPKSSLLSLLNAFGNNKK